MFPQRSQGNNYKAWSVAVDDFNNHATRSERLKHILRFAILAPSSHNAQPWSFRIEGKKIIIFPNQQRLLKVSDPNQRLLHVTMGGLVKNIFVAGDYYGYRTTYELSPEEYEGALVAVTCERVREISYDRDHLIYAISERVSNRNKFDSDIPSDFVDEIDALSDQDISFQHITERKDRVTLAHIMMTSRLKAFDNPSFRAEMAEYKRNNFSHSYTGIPGFTMGFGNLLSLFAPFLIRYVNVIKFIKKSEYGMLIEHTPRFLIVQSKDNTPESWFLLGFRMQTVALRAAREGLGFSYNVAAQFLQDEFKEKCGTPLLAQMILRIGKVDKKADHAPRLPVERVLQTKREVKIEEVAQFLEYDDHAHLIRIEDPTVDLVGYIAIHRIHNGHPSLGATRLWRYDNEEETIRDALRLSKIMTSKSVLAGLPYGGAKAVLMMPPDGVEDRKAFFEAYARKVNELNGLFVTGSDMGVSMEDVSIMRSVSPNIIGAGLDSAQYTAEGVFIGIQEVLRELFSTSEVSGRTFAVQGAGNTGRALIELLLDNGAHVRVSDTNKKKAFALKDEFPEVEIVLPKEIYQQDVDIFCPCAIHSVLNRQTIPLLSCKAVVGSANNQLAEGAGELLMSRGILYAPDYIVNSGGMISVTDQFIYESADPERIRDKLRHIAEKLRKVFSRSKRDTLPIDLVADELVSITINTKQYEGHSIDRRIFN